MGEPLAVVTPINVLLRVGGVSLKWSQLVLLLKKQLSGATQGIRIRASPILLFL
jgi:hypothetical protein